MTKIKIVGAFIFIISIVLAFLFENINSHNIQNNNLLKNINQQKSFMQEISKNIFYISKHRDSSTHQLSHSIKLFLSNMEDENIYEIDSIQIKEQSEKITLLWNEFYTLVQKFQDQKKVTTAYSNILLEKTVVRIYNKNLKLVLEFNKLLKISKEYTNAKMSLYKNIQYSLLITLVLLLLYLFTQLKSLLEFIQKFRHTSKKIISNSSIKELEPLNIKTSADDVGEATKDFNYLVQSINESVKDSSKSLEHSYKSLEVVEKKIETLMELLYTMQENENINDDLNKKEDALIQSLEEITTSGKNLQNLQKDLDTLLSYYKK